MIPIVMKLTAYATYAGQACVRSVGSSTAPSTLRIRSVAAIAKTPSANVSSLATRLAWPGGDRLVRHARQHRLLRATEILRLPAVQVALVREPERVRRARPAAADRMEEGRIAGR